MDGWELALLPRTGGAAERSADMRSTNRVVNACRVNTKKKRHRLNEDDQRETRTCDESGHNFAEELALRSGPGGRNNYNALAGLGRDGLTACLNSSRQPGAQSSLPPEQIQRFVREFFSWKDPESESRLK